MKNKLIKEEERLVWDFPYLMKEILTSISKAFNFFSGIKSIGISTWGCDYGYIYNGSLMRNPVSYRDERTFGFSSPYYRYESIYNKTGIQYLHFNTINQVFYDLIHDSKILDRAETLLLIPDLIAYYLTGELPIFKNINANIEEDIQIKGITNADKGLAVNLETVLTTQMQDLVYFTLDQAPEGVTLENGKIIVSDLVTLMGESVVVSVRSIFDASIAHTEEFTINSIGITIEGNFADLEIDRPDSGETVDLDLSTIDGISGSIVSVYADNHLMENTGTNLLATFNKSDFPKRFGEQTLNIKVSDGTNEYNYQLTVTLASLIVENADDLKLMRNIAYALGGDVDVKIGEQVVSMINFDGYFILANNIDCTDLYWNDDYNFFTNNHGWESALFDGAGFHGTIDGRGYVLKGLNTSGQGFISRFGSNGVLKNIGIEGSFQGTWGGYVSNHFAGTIENVYIKVSVPPVHGTLDFSSNILTGDFSAPGSVIKNVIIVFDTPVHYNNVSSPLMGVYRSATHHDVYAVNTTGNVAGTSQEAGDTVKTFADAEAFKTFIAGNNEFEAKWNHYWDTTGDYPVFINAQ